MRPRVGCSGWNYKDWRGSFYPADLPQWKWLRHYASVFDSCEINGTFYRLPEASTFKAWREAVPNGFLFAVKASRFLTHLKRLREPREPVKRLFQRSRALGDRLGPVLYQLPPNMKIDLPRLEEFAHTLPKSIRGVPVEHVIEFREPSWYTRETFDLLERVGLTLCLYDKRGSAIVEPMIGPAVYVRFHGTSGHYHGSYPTARLDRWAARLAERVRDGKPVYAYFNNDPRATATQNALTLRKQLEARLD